MSEVKRWFARDPDKFAATAQVSVVLASDYDQLHAREQLWMTRFDQCMQGRQDDIATLTAQVKTWKQATFAKQAQIDRLMIEFCPGEMSKEQRDEWARNQVRSSHADGERHGD